MALALDLPTIGLALMFVGFILVVLALAKRTGDYKRGDVGIVGAVLFAVGFVMAFGLALLSIGQPTQPSTQAGAVWKIEMTSSSAYDDTAASPATGTVTTVAADGQSADTFASRADMNDAGAIMSAVVSVINLNNPSFSGQSFQILSHIGTFPTISDPSTGAAYPLIDPSASDPAVADVTWTDADSDGVQTKANFYDNVAALGTETYTAVADINEAAPAAMTVGQVYSVSFVVGPVTLVWNLHPTA